MAPKQAVTDKKAAGTAKAAKVASALKKRPSVRKSKVRTTTQFKRPKTLALPRNPKCPTRAVPRMPAMDNYRIIRAPMTTESAVKKIEMNNTLIFLCDPMATKPQIRSALKALYDVQAMRVNTLIRPDGIKKAFVRLPPDTDAVDVAHRMGII